MLDLAENAISVTRGSPLVLRFNRPMVDASKVGKPVADAPARFKPAVQATQTWTGRAVLQIEASAGTWEQTRVATLTLSPDLRSLAGDTVPEFEPRTVVFDASPRYHGRRSERIVPGEAARLLFDGKVNTGELASKMLVYEVDGGRRMMPFTLAEQPRDDKGHVPVDLKPGHTLEPGGKFAVAIAPVLSRGGTHPRVVEFEFAPRPRVEGIGCPIDAKEASQCEHTEPPGRVVDIGEALVLVGSSELKEVTAQSVEILPALAGLKVALEDSKRIVIRGDWTPGQVYQLLLKELKDKEGHPLQRFAPLAVRSNGRAPEVRVSLGRLTFERTATPSLPFAAIHVEEGQLRWAPVPAGREIAAVVQARDLIDLGKKTDALSVPLLSLAPDSKPNRWGKGIFPWIENDPSRSALAVFAFLPDKAEREPESIRTTFAQWTDLGLDAKIMAGGVSIWVTSIDKATPVDGAVVTVADAKGVEVGTARTDANGVAWLGTQAGALSSGAVVRAVQGADRAVMLVDWRASIGPRHVGVKPGEEPAGTDMPVASLFTDRGMCRPGESIHVKAVVRTPGAQPKAISTGSMRFRLHPPSTQAPAAVKEVALNAFGTAAADFAIDSNREAGAWLVEAWRDPYQQPIGTVSFTVGEYRPPVFRVDLTSESEGLSEGDPLHAVLSAAYPFGPPAAGARAHWTLTRASSGADYPPRWEDYTFSPADSSTRSGMIDSGDLTLGTDGKAAIDSKIAMASYARQSATLEATVRDPSGQTTSARKQFDTWPARWEVGVHEVPDWVEADSTIDVNAILISHDGSLQSGRPVHAKIIREGWHTWWQWSSHAHKAEDDESEEGSFRARKAKESKVVHECKLTSGAEPVHCTWKADRPGTYLLEASTVDDKGRTSVASVRVYVAGPDEHPDRDAPGTAISLTPTKRLFEVGDTAELAFESPFPDAEALLRIERQSVLHLERRRVSAGGNVMRLLVTPEMVPNVFASVTLVRPRTGEPGAKLDLNAPDLRVATSELTIRPKASPLKVELVFPEAKARAGADLPIEVRVRDAGDHGARAEVALYAVDEGTLRLTGYTTPDPSDGFFPRIAASFAWEDLRRSLVSRVPQDLLPAAGGDGASNADQVRSDLRERFEPTPLWLPALQTDASGVARATLHLPARPTEYRVMAVATDDGARSGRAEKNVIATRAVVVRPVLPRFVTEGDRFEAVAFLHNTTEAPLDVTLATTINGEARPPRNVRVEAGRDARVAEMLGPVQGRSVSIRLKAAAAGETEEVVREVPLDSRGRTMRSEVVGAVAADRPVAIALPQPIERRDGELTLAIASHPFVGFDMSVEALEAGSWGGVEPLASSLIGLASYARLDTGRRPASASAAELQARADKAIKALLQLQSPSGGFGRFSSNEGPDAYLSVYALHSLQSARKVGWVVPDEAMDKAVKWVAEQAKSTTFLDGHEDRGRNDLAFALRVLQQSSAADGGRVQALYDQRQTLSPIGLSNLALAMSSGDRRRDGLVLDAVRKVLATREDERRDPTLLRWYDSSARTLGTVLEAAASMEPMHPESRKLASRILAQRSSDGQASWWSTHETSYALAGLAAYGARFRGIEPLQVRVRLDGAPLSQREHKSDQAWYTIPIERVADGTHKLEMDADGPAFYSLAGSWSVPLGPDDDTARGKVVALHRVLENESGSRLEDGAHVKLGELVRVRVFLYEENASPPLVVIRDRFGGGLEPIDASLETTPQQALWALLGMEDGEEAIDSRGHYASRSLGELAHRAFGERDVRFFVSGSSAGLREFTYGARATTPGTFVLPPAELEALYVPGFIARSQATSLVVEP